MEDFKFSTLEYKRPDFEKTGAFAEEITEKIKNAASYGELKGYMEQMEEMSKNFSTDCTIASIRHTLDTTDEFYEKEDAYINDMVPTVMPKLLAMNDALMESKFRGDIENEYGMILSILVYTFFTRMFDFMLPLVVKYSIVAA